MIFLPFPLMVAFDAKVYRFFTISDGFCPPTCYFSKPRLVFIFKQITLATN